MRISQHAHRSETSNLVQPHLGNQVCGTVGSLCRTEFRLRETSLPSYKGHRVDHSTITLRGR